MLVLDTVTVEEEERICDDVIALLKQTDQPTDPPDIVYDPYDD